MIFRSKPQASFIRLHTSQDGFTLVELLVTIIIMVIVGFMADNAFTGWSTSTLENDRQMALQREVELAVSRISLTLQGATGAAIGDYNGGTDNQLTITSAGGGNQVFRSDPAAANPFLEHNNGVSTENIIRDYFKSGIVVNNLSFTVTPINGKQQVTTTLSLKYTDSVGFDHVVEFRTSTVLRNS